ncbi:MAG TPA: sigma-70 family RNA polymerase sigma factor [Actinomycetota bacterium]
MKTEGDLTVPSELGEGYHATFARLCRMFRARGVPPSETADLAQETIARTLLHLRRRGLMDPGRSNGHAANGNGNGTNGNGTNGNGARRLELPADAGIEPLIKRIAINLLIDRARAAAPKMLPIDGAEEIAQPGLDPSDEVARRQQRAQVHRAIGDLSSRHRTAMLLSLEGLTPAEIATHLGIRRNAADALLYRARRSLAKHLSTLGGLIRGLAVIIALRLRALARRPEATTLSDAAFAGQAVLGIAAATLGTLLVLTLPASTEADAAVPPIAVEAPVSAGADIASVEAPATITPEKDVVEPTRTAGVSPRTDIDVQGHEVHTGAGFKDPATGQDEEFGLDLIHERDEADRGVAGPMLDSVTEFTCDTATACEE